MKRTEIFYKKSAKHVEIIRIENVLSETEISAAFGELVSAEYFGGTPRYSRGYNDIDFYDADGEQYRIAEGGLLYKEVFDKIVQRMEQAVARLCEIRDNTDDEVLSVKI
jgi:hypothetical protein